jgi:hypothetical protein
MLRWEKTCPGVSAILARSSSAGTTISPARRTSDTVYRSPSAMFTVMKMSRLSGEIATCTPSSRKSA